jgi:phosphoribosylformylglycinamidine synthase
VRFYKGIAALSDFRQAKLLSRLQAAEPAIDGIDAEYVHIANLDGELELANEKILKELLTYGTPYNGSNGGIARLVVPRPGTISPWSKAAKRL